MSGGIANGAAGEAVTPASAGWLAADRELAVTWAFMIGPSERGMPLTI